MSDRDPWFTGRFWTEFFKLLATDLNFSMNLHLHIDGQMEWVNALLEVYLPHYVSAMQRDWAKLIDVAQFSYNLQWSDYEEESVRGCNWTITAHAECDCNGHRGSSPTAHKCAKEWHE